MVIIKDNDTQGNSNSLTHTAGYEFARWIHKHGESRGPWRGDEIPTLEKISLWSRGVDEPDVAVFWQGYCEYWWDLGTRREDEHMRMWR